MKKLKIELIDDEVNLLNKLIDKDLDNLISVINRVRTSSLWDDDLKLLYALKDKLSQENKSYNMDNDIFINNLYKHYTETSETETFVMSDEINLTKEQFVKKLINNYGFAFILGVDVRYEELSLEERFYYGVDVLGFKDLLIFDEREETDLIDFMDSNNVPSKKIILTYKNNSTYIYE